MKILNNLMKHIYVYNDYGSSEFSVKELINCFKSVYNNKLNIETIKGEDILNGKLTKNGLEDLKSTILCFGGGFDLGYMKSLNGAVGCGKIKEFVNLGGNYLGICAGAYFATDYVEFDLNGKLEVKGERGLNFLNAKSIGPINKLFKYNSDDEAVAIKIKFNDSYFEDLSKLDYFLYLNGGPYFLFNHESSLNCVKVLANYKNEILDHSETMIDASNQPAIVESLVGNGKCLLSGVHFEFDVNHLDMSNYNIKSNLYDKLITNDSSLVHSNYYLIKVLLKTVFKLE